MKYSKATGQFLWLSLLLRKVTYTYDDYHNVETATTEEGVVYSFEYDNHGNNISVSITSGDSTITSTATYSSNGNRLESTTDALGKTTTYSYNPNTHVLEWVQYPEDTEQTRTEYTYDAMYRIASAAVTTNSELTLSVNYTYEDDLLTQIETGSTTYSFDYGYFGRRNNIMVGSRALATYDYTNDRNRYLSALDYGNGDKVQYSYDKYGRLVAELYEDGETVTYKFDNNGSLATVIDSATDITTKYYYDFTDRLMKYTETGTNYSHSTAYTYDDLNNLISRKQVTDGDTFTTNYTYDDDNRLSTVANGKTTKTYSYDSYGRLCRQVTKVQDTSILSENFTFNNSTDGTSGQIKKYASTYTGGSLAYTYTYDDNGNIASVNDGTYTTSYVYDTLNQLVRENNQAAGKTWTWTYDNAGNITSRSEYAYTTGTLGEPLDTVAYGYDDADWGDLLTSYDGVAITHDQIGNPLNDGTWTYTWEHGRQLSAMSNGTTTWSMTYNADGLRTGRTNGTNKYTYWYNESGQLVRMKFNSLILRLSYGADGRPISISYNGNTYYYVLNQQGDVMALLDSAGNWVVKYTYDAWGNILTTTGSTTTMYNTLAQYNPLRYRGYIYDRETKLYYLQSRYYNPEIGRFINADGFVSTGQGVTGHNMFAYCGNNPVNMSDSMGNWPTWVTSATDAITETETGFYFMKVTSKSFNLGQKLLASLPTTGDPNSSQTLLNPDGTIKQKRWYGPDGMAERDRDNNHSGDGPFPHDHVWRNGKRGKEHLPPSSEYKFSLDPVIGVGIVSVCTIGIIAIAVDDFTGVGTLNDFLLGPLGAGFGEGLAMIFG